MKIMIRYSIFLAKLHTYMHTYIVNDLYRYLRVPERGPSSVLYLMESSSMPADAQCCLCYATS